jgi:uracil phosphoribosyltransferase
MTLFNLSETNSIANQFMAELRDHKIQKDRMRFRKNMERLGEIMAYEISKKLVYQQVSVTGSLGSSSIQTLKTQPVVLTILRAGLPFHQGFLNFFDQADSGFVGAYRKEEGEIAIQLDYVACPPIEGKDVILVDPMLATGKSLVKAVSVLLLKGTPAHLHIVGVVSASAGLQYLAEHLNIPHTVWVCAVDETLNSNFFIVPGLGDAGDLSYGEK